MRWNRHPGDLNPESGLGTGFKWALPTLSQKSTAGNKALNSGMFPFFKIILVCNHSLAVSSKIFSKILKILAQYICRLKTVPGPGKFSG